MQRKWLTIILAAALVLSLATPILAVLDSTSYPYYQELSATSPGSYYIELNSSILDLAKDDFSDLRLVDKQDQEIPYILEQYDNRTNSVTEVKISKNVTLDSGSHIVLLNSKQEHLVHNGIKLQISAEAGYACDVLIEGSDDDSTFDILAMNRIYSQAGKKGEIVLTYPDKSYQYMRLKFTGDNSSGLKIEKASYIFRPLQNQSLMLLNAKIISEEANSANQSSVFLVDMGMKNLTVHNILIQSENTGFSRAVNVSMSNDRENWKPLVTDASIFDYRKQDYVGRQDSIAIDTNVNRYLKVEILNGTEKPLTITGINILGTTPRLMAKLQTGTYRLYYGNLQAAAPSYPKSQSSVTATQSVLPVLKASNPLANPAFKAPAGYESKSFLSSIIINIILLICFLAVALILLRNIIRAIQRRKSRNQD